MGSVNQELLKLRQVIRSSASNEEKNALTTAMVCKLATSHLRRRSPSADKEDEATAKDTASVLSIVNLLADKSPGAFLWGKAHAIGPVMLGLVEQLSHPSEERHRLVLETVRVLIDMLQMGSVNAIGCAGRDAIKLLQALADHRPAAADPAKAAASAGAADADSVVGFAGFAEFCRASAAAPAGAGAASAGAGPSADGAASASADGHFEPSRLSLRTADERRYGRAGVIALCCALHAVCVQWLPMAPKLLWMSLHDDLISPSYAIEEAAEAEGAGNPPPTHAPLCMVLASTLELAAADGIPPPMRGKLQHRLICLLCAGLNLNDEARLLRLCPPPPPAKGGAATSESAAAAAAAALAQAPPLPTFRTADVDEAIAALLRMLHARSRPPVATMRWFRLAVHYALAASASSSLHAALCNSLANLPTDLLPAELRRLIPLLHLPPLRAHLRATLLEQDQLILKLQLNHPVQHNP